MATNYYKFNEFYASYFESQKDNWEHISVMGGFENEMPKYDIYFNTYKAWLWDHQCPIYSCRI